MIFQITKNYTKFFQKIKFDQIIHLAAQAGVRYSFINPKKYIFSNIVGFSNILELSRKLKVKKIIYGSSSSVYGDVKKFPVKENEKCNPISTYSLTKKNNEELAKIYSELYDMKIIGLRFFTVYGQWGRPDMFLFKILKSSLNRKSFKLYNFGDHYRDFTYINDVVDIIFKFMNYKKINNDIFNVSAGKSIKLSLIINELAKYVNLPKIIKVNFQKGDVKKTHGSNRKLKKVLKIKKFIHFKIGLKKTAEWYKANYKN